MTGDAPQPGETPRNEANPWSYADPETAFWRGDSEDPSAESPRHPRRRPAGAPVLEPPRTADHSGEAAEAHQAGAQDVAAALSGESRKPVEQDHHKVDDERFNTAGDGTVYTARGKEQPRATGPEHEPTIIDLLAAIPKEQPVATEQPRPEPVQEVMILPEPDRNRPTVALERGPVPGQPPSGLSRLGRARADRARADRALQDRVRQERASALLETSPFWQAGGENRTEENPTQAWPPPETREKLANAGQPPRRRPRDPRRPAPGLFGLVALGLVAAFFAWVSAEPFWLAVGHGDEGAVTVSACTGSGVTQRCSGQFIAASGAYRVDDLALLGVDPAQRATGSTAPARMVSSESRQAYVGDTGVLVHLRWALSFVLVLLCGLGIAGLTGARRLETARARRGALLMSMAGPLVLLGGFLFVAY
ncbi:hypothetical protein [Actinoplanes friuliensis]|uniref:Uncharacterized protein n=1 Tax=Actinoplanes friuliensis DSM 7358 TaxID=1246995 RepID=U5WDX1_9ACTN|nr:hypothetical protein [Actinoplanes friuliensis]AGZ46220.1 hypothetical protein AFR_39830 [Actinoplanes friuliensis DSM 7358]